MRIVIAGGSGFMGRRLTAAWLAAARGPVVTGPPPRPRSLPAGVTRVVGIHPLSTMSWSLPFVRRGRLNLAASRRADRGRRPHERSFRAGSMRTGAITMRSAVPAAERPKTLVNASGIDIYGHRPEGEMTEDSPPGDSFLAGVVVAWEHAARAAEPLGVRVVLARTALIVAPEALAWRLVLLPFRLFVGGPLGSGRQRFTWIHVDDAVGLYDLAIRNQAIDGPVNMVAPEVPAQRELAREIGRAMHRPAIFPVPAFLLRLVLWGQADIVLHGRVAVPEKALAAGTGPIFDRRGGHPKKSSRGDDGA